MSVQDILDKALSIEPMLRNGDTGKIENGMHDFIKRRNLSMYNRTRKSLINESVMQSVKRDYSRNAMISYRNLIGNPKYFLNMDETAVYLNCTSNRTIHPKGEKIVSIMVGGS